MESRRLPSQLNGSVLRAFSILSLFSEQRREITAGQVSDALGINGVTAHRFLRTLEQAGALVAVSRGVYRLGFLLVDLAERATQGEALGRTLQPVLDAITRDLGEASMATVFEADMVVCIARAVAGRQLSVDIRVGSRLEAYCTAHGKLWLASLGPAELARYLDLVQRDRFSARTLVEREALVAEIETIRRQGYSVNDGEREDGIRAVAVPLWSRTGRMVSALSVFGPTVRMTEEMMDRALARLRAAVGEAEGLLYGQPDPDAVLEEDGV